MQANRPTGELKPPDASDRERFFALSLDPLVIADLHGRIHDLNPAWERILGHDPNELKGRDFIELVHTEDAESALAAFRAVRAGHPVSSFQCRVQHADGSWKWLSWWATPDPEHELIYAIAKDVTDAHEAEETRRESEAGFGLLAETVERQLATLREQAALIDLANEAILVRDLKGTILFWNRGAEALYGYPREHALGKIAHVLLETRAARPLHEINARLVTAGRWEGELSHTRHDGSSLIADSRWVLNRDPGTGRTTVLEIATDITERKAAEEAMRESEARFRAIFRSVGVGMALGDLEGRLVEVNPTLARMLGARESELQGTAVTDLTHPEDADMEAEFHRQLMEGRRAQYRVEKRFIRPDGGMVPARVTVSGIEDSAGTLRYTIAMVEDLSLALIDELTGMSNRRAFVYFGQQQVKLALRDGRSVALLWLDVEGMRTINEMHGHFEGDRALVDTARLLATTFRASDFISRVGGDEFCVLLSGGGHDPQPAVARLREAVAAWNRQKGRVYELGFGVAVTWSTPDRPRSIEELIDDAERTRDRERLGGPAR
jgi:PAS domain S-box-containing protein/diguanylate cyclase (GGDEF)-like protein